MNAPLEDSVASFELSDTLWRSAAVLPIAAAWETCARLRNVSYSLGESVGRPSATGGGAAKASRAAPPNIAMPEEVAVAGTTVREVLTDARASTRHFRAPFSSPTISTYAAG